MIDKPPKLLDHWMRKSCRTPWGLRFNECAWSAAPMEPRSTNQ